MKWFRLAMAAALMLVAEVAVAQKVLRIEGRVVSGRDGVPYATLQVVGSTIGVCCNEAGEYVLKVPVEFRDDSVEVRSMGHETVRRSVADLRRNGRVAMRVHEVELREVRVATYRDAQRLMLDVVRNMQPGYWQQTAYSTFFYRDWRAVDGELYLFDEAVMEVERAPYAEYAAKEGYRFAPSVREMETNYKSVLRHRLLVNDRAMLQSKVGSPDGVNGMMMYADDMMFYDPVAAPNASYALSEQWLRRKSYFPVMEFTDGGEVYYLVRARGQSSVSKETMYEYVIRKHNMKIVRIASWIDRPVRRKAPGQGWMKGYFNNMTYEADSTTWIYDERDGRLTLSRYYSTSTIRLASRGRGHDGEEQCWQHNMEWTLTRFSTAPTAPDGSTLDSRPHALDAMFGPSDFSTGFWADYNTVPIDTLPLRLLREKFTK